MIAHHTPLCSDTRVADRLLDDYLATTPGTPTALEQLHALAEAHREGVWESNPEANNAIHKPRPRGAASLSTEEKKRLAEMHVEGVHVDKIALSVQIKPNQVYRALVTNEVMHYVTKLKLESAVEMRRQGLTLKQIAEQTGVSVTAVQGHLSKLRTKDGDDVSANQRR